MIPINKRKIDASIFLSIITLGIYKIFWECLLIANTRAIKKGKLSYTAEILCILFVPFYSLYWWFARGKIVKEEFAKHGYLAVGNPVLYLILSIFGLDIVSMSIMQHDFNSLASESPERKVTKNRIFKLSVQAICRIAMFSALIEAQELAFLALPNVQLTQLLIVVYSASFGLLEALAMVTCYWFIDNVVMGSFSVTYSPAMLAGWILLVLITFLVYKFMVKKPDGFLPRLIPALFTAFHAFLYCWGFMFVSCVMYHMPFKAYFISDLPFELALAATGFVTVFILSPTLIKLLKKLKKK